MTKVNWIKASLKAVFACVYFANPALAECVDSVVACQIPTGSYHIALPKKATDKAPVIIFLHGYGGSGKATINNRRVTKPLLERGYAVIAPNGLKREGGRATAWNFHPDFHRGRNEAGFLKEVLDDAVTRFSVDRAQVVLGGFSIGGSMTSYIACNAPSEFTAFAPVSGSFWRPHPTECKKPVKLLHTHGWADKTVPLEGRKITEDFVQGDVFYALNLWRKTNKCEQHRADRITADDNVMRRKWEQCDADSALEFALFSGGHTVPKGWANMMLDWFEGLPN
jgi:polyhydroxybutyrate depolymerase